MTCLVSDQPSQGEIDRTVCCRVEEGRVDQHSEGCEFASSCNRGLSAAMETWGLHRNRYPKRIAGVRSSRYLALVHIAEDKQSSLKTMRDVWVIALALARYRKPALESLTEIHPIHIATCNQQTFEIEVPLQKQSLDM